MQSQNIDGKNVVGKEARKDIERKIRRDASGKVKDEKEIKRP